MSEFMQRPSRPAQQTPAAASTGGSQTKNNKGGGRLNGMGGMHIGMGILLIAGAFLALATVALLVLNSGTAVDNENDRITEDKYQAVFLDSQDGQVYFGRLTALDSANFMLQDIYYVQVQTATAPDTGQQQTTGISLAKLGNELHGPEDQMFIQKDQVLFWENLKDDGQVVCAIRDYQINDLQIEGITRDAGCDERDANASVDASDQQSVNQGGSAAGTQPAGTPQVDDTPAVAPDPDLSTDQ